MIRTRMLVVCCTLTMAPSAQAQPWTSPRCGAALDTVSRSGDRLPDGFTFRCSDGKATDGHWGTTSGQDRWIAADLEAIGPSDAKLRYVVAHETCHARAYAGQEPFTWTDERAADQCAKRYGFPNVYFARTDVNWTRLVFGCAAAFVLGAAGAFAVRRRRRR